MTTGIISALDRNINIDGITMNLLQTSTAVSPGNSGCPLIDMTGHVIGVINSKSGGTSVEGIGFAISSNKALSAINDLMEYGYVRGKAALGISVNIKYTSAYASYYNLPEGALVQSVASGYCSDKAGIVAGDVIVGIDDTVVGSYQDLESALKSYKAGDTVTVKVNRAGQELTMTVTLDEKTPELTQESITVESSEPENNQDQSPENNQDLPSQGNLPQVPDQEEETPSGNSESDLFDEFFPWFQD